MSVRIGWFAVTDTVTVSDEDGGEAEFPMAEWMEFLDAVRKNPGNMVPGPGLRPADYGER